MKKRVAMAILTAAVLGLAFTGCGKEEKKKDGPATMEDVAELLDNEEASKAAQSEDGPMFENIEETVAAMPQKVADEIQTNGIISQEDLLSMVTMTVAQTVDPCMNEEVTENSSHTAYYLVTLGKEKAPEHALTKLGEALNTYIDLVAVKGGSAYDVAVENQLNVIDQIVYDFFGDDTAIAAQVTDFYQSVQ